MELTDQDAVDVLEFARDIGVEIQSGYEDDMEYIKGEAEEILLDAKQNKDSNDKARSIYEEFENLYETQTVSQKENLPLPLFVHIDALPEMPADLTSCSDEDIRRLHSQFHAYQVRTNWLCGLQENKVNEAKYNYKLAYDREMLRIDPFFREGNRAPKEKTKSYIEAEIMQNNAVVRLKEILVRLEADLSELKTLADIYEANVTRLSRESSMRYAERA